ncbi:MAG TPA: hypothetical protein P5089_03550 [Candidatus Portnoybacteria bacterium]|nr:hypothetical protein [Candidatus Portnoybacteria bacterium]
MTETKRKKEATVSLVVDIEKLDHSGENNFSIVASATLVRGDRPLGGQQIKIFIDGVESEPLITDQDHGRVLYRKTFSTINQSFSIEARQIGFNTRSAKITRLLPWPDKKKNDEAGAKLEILATRYCDNILYVSLVRLDKDGKGSPGQIFYIDQVTTGSIIQTIKAQEHGIALLILEKKEEKRRVIAFLPEKLNEKIRIDVLGTKNVEEKDKTVTPEKSLFEKMRKAFAKGEKDAIKGSR